MPPAAIRNAPIQIQNTKRFYMQPYHPGPITARVAQGGKEVAGKSNINIRFGLYSAGSKVSSFSGYSVM